MLNILTEDLIRYKRDDGAVETASLPQVYAALMQDEVASFPALRPHQRHAWHAFLVQLGAMAMHREGLTEPPEDAETWRNLIRFLTRADYPDDEPWQLVVDDITKPAFMQPPASSEDKRADYKPKDDMATPDQLDLLVTAKSHDLKPAVAIDAGMDDWLFALIVLQTMEGYMGIGHHGISRMNGGASSRTAFSLTPSIRLGIHVSRDIKALLGYRETLLDEYPTTEEGFTLLWTHAWDGAASEAMNISELDPFYIEICRRIRLISSHERLQAKWAPSATTNGTRIQAKALKGMTGDPWALINRKRNVALTPIVGEFSYRRVVDFMTPGDWQVPPLFKPTSDEYGAKIPMQLVARAIIRSQGKTEGYFERIIPLKSKTISAFGRPRQIEEFGDIARDRIEQIGKIQQFMRHAISVFLAGGENQAGDIRARQWADKLSELADKDFFEDLQDEFDIDDADERKEIRNAWCIRKIDDARALLRQAMDALPCPTIQRYRARVRAESVFEGRIRSNNGFPELYS